MEGEIQHCHSAGQKKNGEKNPINRKQIKELGSLRDELS